MDTRTLQLEIALKDVEPRIWRRFVVGAETTLAELHAVFQIVMGWDDTHVHAFVIRGQRFGRPDPDDYVPVVDERKHRIGAFARKGETFTYEYDFGDEWVHEIKFEGIRERAASDVLPSCVDGRRACPPEDCGGPHGYAQLLGALRKPTSKNAELREWIGGVFDAEKFDRAAVNTALQKRARRRTRAKRALH